MLRMRIKANLNYNRLKWLWLYVNYKKIEKILLLLVIFEGRLHSAFIMTLMRGKAQLRINCKTFYRHDITKLNMTPSTVT